MKKIVFIFLTAIIIINLLPSLAVAGEYRLHIDDRLNISVWGHADLQQEVMVEPDGMISFPLIGKIQAAGLSKEELRGKITDKLSIYIKDPRVNVSLLEYMQAEVMIMGEVRVPGTYQIKEGERILDLISRAGGLTETADTSTLRMIRDNEKIELNLSAVFSGDKDLSENNYRIQDGDTVFVPHSMIEVTVLGEVRNPGQYKLEKDLRLSHLLARAGSLTEQAAKEATYISDGQMKKIDLERLLAGDLEENSLLKAGDSLYIPEASYQVTILGEVNEPGRYQWHENLHLADLVAGAGNQTERGDIENVQIQHRDGSSQTVNLNSYFTDNKEIENPVLKPGDVVLVKELSTSPRVAILGEVNKPGAYSWDKDLNLADLMARAGNQTERGDISQIRVLHTDGEYVEIDLKQYFQGEKGANPALQAGDIILVGEKDSIDWKEVFTYVSGLNVLKSFLGISW